MDGFGISVRPKAMNTPQFLDYLKAKSCIFWDWNGTLLDDLDYSLGVNNKILESKGSATLSKQYYQKIFTIPISMFLDNLELEKRGIGREEITDLFISNYEKNRHTVDMFNGAKDCLFSLKESGVTQVLFSAAHISEIEFQVNHHGISECFEILSAAGDFYGGCKLDRGRAVKEEYGFTNGVLVGDTLHDVQIGKEIGFETVWVSEGHQSIERAEGQNFIDYIYNRKTGDFYKNSSQ